MVGSGDPAHHAAAARVVLAGDAVGQRAGGTGRQAPGPWRGMVQEPGPDVLRWPRRCPTDPLGGRGGAPDPVAGGFFDLGGTAAKPPKNQAPSKTSFGAFVLFCPTKLPNPQN